ncbi:hypothetical protein RNZ50_21105 [Paracoccaceae bacterium Fryx2]|nr:hypothetical protein [Paracoccaceae bacterium Fryx2]
MRQLVGTNAGLLVVGLLSFVLMGAGQSMYGPALPAFARMFALGGNEVALLVSAHWVGAAVGVTAMFLRADKVTPRLMLALMALGAGMVASGLHWGLVLLGAVVFGAGYGGSTTIYNRRFLMRFGARGPAMLSLLNAVFGIGAIGAPLAFVALGSDTRLAYGLVAVLTGLAVLGAGAAGPAEPATATAGRFSFRPGILTFGALAIGVEASLIGLGPVALIAAGETEARAAELLSLFFVAFLAARLGLVWVSGALAPFTLFTLALGLAGGLALGAAMVDAALFFVALGVCAGMFFPAFYVCASVRMGDDARVSATIIAAGLAGGIVCPLLLGVLMARFGDAVFFWVIAGMTLAAFVAGVLALGRMNRPEPAPGREA